MKNRIALLIVPQLCSLFMLFVALLVMVGWVQKNPYLIQVLPHLVPMQFNTAFSFLVMGLALWTLTLNLRKIPCFLGALGIIIPFLTLFQYFFNLDFAIDELFVHSDILVRTSHAGRMSPNSALLFIFSGLGILFLCYSSQLTKNYVAAIFASIIFIFSGEQLVEYVLGIEAVKAWNYYSQMAVHTSLLFMLLGIALFLRSLTFSKEGKISKWFYVALCLTLFGLSIRLWDDLFIVKIHTSPFVFIAFFMVFVVVLSMTVFLMKILFSMLNTIEIEAFYTAGTQNYKSELIRHISHELKKPVATLQGFVEILKSEKEEAKLQEIFVSLESLTEHISGVCQDLLGYARIESGQLNLDEGLFETKPWLKRIQNMYSEKARKLEKRFVLTLGETFPETLFGDEIKISQIIFNFLDNALKFSDEKGQVELHLEYSQENLFRIAVSNTGPGIPEDTIKGLFTPFTQFDTDKAQMGSGLGLSICAYYVDKMKGKISVESRPNERTTFYAFLPLKSQPPPV